MHPVFYIVTEPTTNGSEVEPTGCGNPDCECNDTSAADALDAAVDCVACDFEEWAGDALLHIHDALTNALRSSDRADQVRVTVHALEILEDVLDSLFPEGDPAVA